MHRPALFGVVLVLGGMVVSASAEPPLEISGRYPHLAVSNRQGECGIGAVVPWAERLWYITYGPHLPSGSDDKLYELDADLRATVRPESIGGTPANRMIHRESNQLSIGPYFIDARRNVRAIPYSTMFGRLTATARHLTDPAGKVYICDMEGLIYEVDVRTLEVKLLFKRPVPGWHGKGGYSGQGRLVLAYNGEEPTGSVDRYKPFDYWIDPAPQSPEDAGALAEWDGGAWRLVARRQSLDVTGPGGILGPPDDKAPLWAVGWDRRSLLLHLCDGGRWQTFRLPMADYSYTGRHGWHTEWPRIREVTGGKFLMNLHGGWFDFPPGFSSASTAGLRPVADYLKITADFCPWNDRIVFGCDDTAQAGFSQAGVGDTLNRLNGQSNSNLWFTTWDRLAQAGRPAGFGGVWLRDPVHGGVPSEPYLLAGYTQRVIHLAHRGGETVAFRLEIDRAGDGRWTEYRTIAVAPGGYAWHVIPDDVEGEWLRVVADRDARDATAYLHYGPGGGAETDRTPFSAIADIDAPGAWTSAIVRSESGEALPLGVQVRTVEGTGNAGPPRTYQVSAELAWTPTGADSDSARFLVEKAAQVDRLIEIDDASVIVREKDLRMRLPKSHPGYDAAWPTGWPRAMREVVTERSLINAAGTFYVLPRTNSGGLRRIKPVCTHNKRITDFCSWRGLLVLAGCLADAKADGHYFAAPDAPVGLWFGDIDDLWKLGKPVGVGGPWKATPVEAGKPSDPYLMAGYDRKRVVLRHDATEEVAFTLQVDLAGDGTWLPYATLRVPAGQEVEHVFPEGYAAHWICVQVSRACKATAQFTYE